MNSMLTPLRSEEAATAASPSASDNQHHVQVQVYRAVRVIRDSSSGGYDDLESEQEGSDFKRQRRFEPTSVVLPLPSPVGTHSTNWPQASNNPLSSVVRHSHINNNADFDRQYVNYILILPITCWFTMPSHANQTIDNMRYFGGCVGVYSEPRDYQVKGRSYFSFGLPEGSNNSNDREDRTHTGTTGDNLYHIYLNV